MLRDYDHGGSVDLRIDAIEDAVRIPYSSNYGGLITYVDRYQALMAEMDTIAPLEYDDGKKQRLWSRMSAIPWSGTWHSGARMMPVICHVC
jgi:hypothetical protein